MHTKQYWQSPHINCIKSWVWMRVFGQRKQNECCLFLDSFPVVKFLLLWKFYHFAHKRPLQHFWIICLIYSAIPSFLALQPVYIPYMQFSLCFLGKEAHLSLFCGMKHDWFYSKSQSFASLNHCCFINIRGNSNSCGLVRQLHVFMILILFHWKTAGHERFFPSSVKLSYYQIIAPILLTE